MVKPNALTGLSAEEITGYLRATSSQGKWQDWQFRQLVDALQLLLVDLADVKAARVVDWDYWREAGPALPADHPTIAREEAPEARLKDPKFAASAEAFPVLATLARTLRTKQYSIRTEQTYVDWGRRFLHYCKGKSVERLLGCMEGTFGLVGGLLYGTGMRLMEGLRLRVGDVDFGHESILVRNGKGDKDRVVPLPKRYLSALAEHLKEVKALHRADLAVGAGAVYLPYALARKYPNAPREWI
mgnify:CR=1 FL=1